MGVVPKTFLIGSTQVDLSGLYAYLEHVKATEFFKDIEDCVFGDAGLDNLCLVSFYAKLCYKSLVLGQNQNVTAVRAIEDNLMGVFKSGHGSVFEHVWLNFVTTDCSRVFTHELVRHRVGVAYSQTSGRYVALDKIDLVIEPAILSKNPRVGQLIDDVRANIEHAARELRGLLIKEGDTFEVKKKMTSFIRRIAPNGQSNEIGWSCNVRALRHMIEMRTSRHAEWEIRQVFNDVAHIVESRWPLMLYGGSSTMVDGLLEYKDLHI